MNQYFTMILQNMNDDDGDNRRNVNIIFDNAKCLINDKTILCSTKVEQHYYELLPSLIPMKRPTFSQYNKIQRNRRSSSSRKKSSVTSSFTTMMSLGTTRSLSNRLVSVVSSATSKNKTTKTQQKPCQPNSSITIRDSMLHLILDKNIMEKNKNINSPPRMPLRKSSLIMKDTDEMIFPPTLSFQESYNNLEIEYNSLKANACWFESHIIL